MKSPKKQMKEPSLPSQDETRRANVLREEMLSQFRMLGETLSGFRDRMDRMEPQIQQTNEKVNILYPAVRSLGTGFRALRSDVTDLKSDVTVLKSDVAVLKSDVGVLKSDVAVLKVDVAEIKNDLKGYNHRLSAIEA